MKLIQAWNATFTRRWHRHAHLSSTVDPIGGHQGRVALLALILFPNAHAVHRAAIIHDMGEAVIGDVPNPVKESSPALKAELDRLESIELDRLGLPPVELSDLEKIQLRLCDKLDALLWAYHHKSDIIGESGWRKDVASVTHMMWQTGIGEISVDLLRYLKIGE